MVTLNTGIAFADQEQFEHMLPVPKRVLWTVWDCPDLFYAPFAFASGSMRKSQINERALVVEQYKDIPYDQRLIEDPVFYDLARVAMRDFMSTPKRSADELVHWVRNWTSALENVSERLTTLFLQSEHHDFLEMQMTKDYLSDLKTPRFMQIDDSAQLCVFEKPEVIANEIKDIISDQRGISFGHRILR